MPNRHLHPHIEPPPPPQKEKKSIFKKGHRRATSHHIFKEMHPIAIETPTDSECGMDREVGSGANKISQWLTVHKICIFLLSFEVVYWWSLFSSDLLYSAMHCL